MRGMTSSETANYIEANSYPPNPLTGCRLWKRACDQDGYALMWLNGKQRRVGRVVLELGGVCVRGRNALHKCDVPRCVEFGHMFAGTAAQNSADMVAKGRSARGRRHGRRTKPERTARGERHGLAKLTEEAVRAIRASTKSTAQLARDYGVGETVIRRARRGEGWRHLS